VKDQLASEAFYLYSEFEPTGAFALIAPDAEWASEPTNINSDSPIRARPDPSRQVRDNKDSQRESDNKGILGQATRRLQARPRYVEKSIVASICTGLCSAVAASHTTGFLRNCYCRWYMYLCVASVSGHAPVATVTAGVLLLSSRKHIGPLYCIVPAFCILP
jgi:hypothetical protein